MKSYIDSIKTTDRNGNKAILYPETKQEAVFGLNERLAKLEIADITTTADKSMPNSHKGRLMFEEIGGVSEQGENPSPDNPQEIKKSVVSGVKTHGKNMIKYPYPDVSKTDNGITFTDNGDGSVTVNGTATAMATFAFATTQFYELEATYLKVSSGIGYGPAKPIIQADIYCDGVYSSTIQTSAESNSKREFVGKITLGVCRIKVESGVTVNNVTVYPMICDADIEDDAYEPYTESSITLSSPMELCGIGDVQDVIDIENGKKSQIICEKTIMASDLQNVITTAENVNQFRFIVYPNYDTSSYVRRELDGICNKFKHGTLDDLAINTFTILTTNDSGWNGAALAFFLVDKSIETLDDFMNLVGDDLKVYFKSPTEEVTPLPIADQIALNSLATYDGATYLEWDCYLEPTFKGEYGTSKVGGYTLEGLLTGRNAELLQQSNADRITALETALINNV